MLSTPEVEKDFGHGAIPLNKVHRRVNKLLRKRVAKGFSFDWDKGYDVRNIVGPIKIKNQGSNYSCGGQAGAYFIQIQRALQSIKEDELSAKSLYAPIAYIGGGTTVVDLMTQIGSVGLNKENSVPSYYIDGSPLSESMMIEKSWSTPQTTKDALTRAGYTPYDIGENIDEVASTIQNYGAVIWEIRGKNNGTWLTKSPVPPERKSPQPYWHHFMCCIGAKMINGKKTIIALQSMGTGVGESGVQYFGEEWFTSRNIIDCFTFIHNGQLVPAANNKSIWAEICRWFQMQWKQAKGIIYQPA